MPLKGEAGLVPENWPLWTTAAGALRHPPSLLKPVTVHLRLLMRAINEALSFLSIGVMVLPGVADLGYGYSSATEKLL